jgi:lipoyl synthase
VLRTVIRLSAGTAARIGLTRMKSDDLPATAYLLFGEGCLMDCAFCPQARSAGAHPERLGRITWRAFPRERVLAYLHRAAGMGFERICLQSVRQKDGLVALAELVGAVKACSSLPLSVSVRVESTEEAAALFAAGANRISIALDAVNPRDFARLKSGSFEQCCNLLRDCSRLFPGRICTHIICGLGETEEEAAAAIAALFRSGVSVALFAFTPLRGTRLAGHPPPEPASYRRLQAVHYLLRQGLASYPQLRFREGRLVSFGLEPVELERHLAGGEAFQTSGCSGCNRPYYNERPGGFAYNYPRRLNAAEAATALALALAPV